jgi:hypothetical protein
MALGGDMLIKASGKRVEECPTCRGMGFIEFEMKEFFIPEKTQEYPTPKLMLAFILGFLVLSPALLGLYWEIFLSKWRP